MDLSTAVLRVIAEVAERGSITGAAQALGYSQSGISRQIAAAERAVGYPIFTRRRTGVRPTRAGSILIRRGAIAVRAIDAAEDEIAGVSRSAAGLRIGAIPAAGVILLPPMIRILGVTHPDLGVITRQRSTPLLLRALRSGTIDLAVVSERVPFRAIDAGDPPLVREKLLDTTLHVAVGAQDPLADRESVRMEELAGLEWIASPSSSAEPRLGVWPGLPSSTRVVHRADDWLAKLRLVAACAGVTTVPGPFVADLVPGVRVLRVDDAPGELRRVSAVHLPDHLSDAGKAALEALHTAVEELTGAT